MLYFIWEELYLNYNILTLS